MTDHLTLNNDAGGIIDATGVLTIDTGHTVNNAGLLEAAAGGTLHIEDAVSNSGAGYALIEGGTLELMRRRTWVSHSTTVAALITASLFYLIGRLLPER